MVPKDPLCSQLVTGPYSVPDESNPHLNPASSRSIIILFCHLRLGLPSRVLPSDSPAKMLYSFFNSPCRLHARQPTFLDIIIQEIFGEEYKLYNSHRRTCNRLLVQYPEDNHLQFRKCMHSYNSGTFVTIWPLTFASAGIFLSWGLPTREFSDLWCSWIAGIFRSWDSPRGTHHQVTLEFINARWPSCSVAFTVRFQLKLEYVDKV
jgi:hypothetical protein